MSQKKGAPKYRVGNDAEGFHQTDLPRQKKSLQERIGPVKEKKSVQPSGSIMTGPPPKNIPSPRDHGTTGQESIPDSAKRRVRHSPLMTEVDHQKMSKYRSEKI